MTHGSGADIFGRRQDIEWEMFCRGGANGAPFSPAPATEPLDLEPAPDPPVESSSTAGRVRHFHAPVVGVPYPNSDGTSRRDAVAGLRKWERVRLRHCPDNPVDSNAVAVLRDADERQLGYLPATVTKDVVAAA